MWKRKITRSEILLGNSTAQKIASFIDIYILDTFNVFIKNYLINQKCSNFNYCLEILWSTLSATHCWKGTFILFLLSESSIVDRFKLITLLALIENLNLPNWFTNHLDPKFSLTWLLFQKGMLVITSLGLAAWKMDCPALLFNGDKIIWS